MNSKLTVLVVAALALRCSAAERPVGFNRDIRPIFSNICYKCHGPDVKNNQSDLRLDLPEMALSPHKDKNGRVSTPIIPGQLAGSEVWRRITTTDPAAVMPPRDSLLQLSDRDKGLIEHWIEQGAKYEAHWAYIAPKKSEPPALAQGQQARNPIDQFVLAALAEQGIKPAPEADRAILIRRVTLDLLGLPPTPAETSAFLADSRPDAYERVVDRLLASPHYGERMAVPWLDLARFADSVGYHGDQIENNFPYREYVIDAFNRNEPFDQFTTEQIAGDLLPQATDRQRVATGFNRLNMMTREGGAQAKEYLAKYAADRVRTVSTTWLGSTMACCECHDHKFDPFKTRDFYSLEAYFADVKQYGVYRDYGSSPEAELEGFTNDSPFPPEIQVKSAYLLARQARTQARLAAIYHQAAQDLVASPACQLAVNDWAAAVGPRLKIDALGWAVARIGKTVTEKNRSTDPKPDGSVLIIETQPTEKKEFETPEASRIARKELKKFVLTAAAPAGPTAAVRIEVLPDPAYDGRVTCAEPDAFTISEVSVELQRAGQAKLEPVVLAAGYADRPTDSYVNGEISMSVLAGWTAKTQFVREAQAVSYLLAKPLVLGEGDQLVFTMKCNNVGRLRLATSPLGCRMPADRLSAEDLAAFSAAQPTAEQQALLATEYFRGTGLAPHAEYAVALADLKEIADCRDGWAYTVVTAATKPAVTRVLPRGDWQNETGEIVQPAPPAFLVKGMAADSGASSASGQPAPTQTRLDLAKWLVSRNNPLTARTFVNRLWAQCFGAGLSSTVDDLGTRGDYPSNPELLDWLAVEFMDRGWDVKAMVRLMVTSATYRQSSRYRPELAEIDPANRQLARQNPRRLDAEFVRDNALFAGGLLNLDLGGPSSYPYQPEGYYAAILFPTRDYVADTGDRQYRRGLYVHWQRTFLHPMMANFDAPSREECTASRNISSTPQQALTLLNDPTFVEAARALAERVLAEDPQNDFGARLDLAYDRLLARPPRPAELQSLQKYYGEQLDYYRSHVPDAEKLVAIGQHPAPIGLDRPELAAWTTVTRTLLNLNEAIVRY